MEVFLLPFDNITALILDIIAVVIVIFIVARCGTKGFISSIISFLGGLASLLIAYFVSGPISQYIYTSFLEERFVLQISNSLSDITTTNANVIVEGLQNGIDSLPAPLLSLMQINSQEVISVISNNIGQSAQTISTQLCENVVKPLVIALVAAVLFILIFIVLSLIFKLLSKAFSKIKKVPVIGPVNTALGVVFGVLYGFIVLYVLSVIMNLLILFFGNSIPYLTLDTLQDSYIFGFLSSLKF